MIYCIIWTETHSFPSPANSARWKSHFILGQTRTHTSSPRPWVWGLSSRIMQDISICSPLPSQLFQVSVAKTWRLSSYSQPYWMDGGSTLGIEPLIIREHWSHLSLLLRYWFHMLRPEGTNPLLHLIFIS